MTEVPAKTSRSWGRKSPSAAGCATVHPEARVHRRCSMRMGMTPPRQPAGEYCCEPSRPGDLAGTARPVKPPQKGPPASCRWAPRVGYAPVVALEAAHHEEDDEHEDDEPQD